MDRGNEIHEDRPVREESERESDSPPMEEEASTKPSHLFHRRGVPSLTVQTSTQEAGVRRITPGSGVASQATSAVSLGATGAPLVTPASDVCSPSLAGTLASSVDPYRKTDRFPEVTSARGRGRQRISRVPHPPANEPSSLEARTPSSHSSSSIVLPPPPQQDEKEHVDEIVKRQTDLLSPAEASVFPKTQHGATANTEKPRKITRREDPEGVDDPRKQKKPRTAREKDGPKKRRPGRRKRAPQEDDAKEDTPSSSGLSRRKQRRVLPSLANVYANPVAVSGHVQIVVHSEEEQEEPAPKKQPQSGKPRRCS